MILRTFDGVVIHITDEESTKIIQAKADDGVKDIHIRGATIPKSSIALYPDSFWEEKEGQGVLWDGTRVVRKFGQWVDARQPDLALSWEYYPELTKDLVMTPSEYEYRKGEMSTSELGWSKAYLQIMQAKQTGLAQKL